MALFRKLATAFIVAWAACNPVSAQTAKVTFVLVNDIYLMNEQRMADGRARGGFPRLAALVKAERAKGGTVIFAHAGDTLSPSLMSGIDKGAHIVALTNLIAPDIFVPGNHEFDFGKDVFLTRMGETKFPLYAANLRDAAGRPIPGFRDRAIVDVGGVKIGLTGGTADDSAVKSSPGDLKFAPTVRTVAAQAAALRSEGADFVAAVVHANRTEDIALFNTRAADLILTGDDHDLYVNYDGRTAIVESSADAHYVTAIDVTIRVTARDGARIVTWWPNFRVIDTADVEPDPDVAAIVKDYEASLAKELDVPIATAASALDSRRAVLRASEAAIGNLFADALREATGADAAIINGGAIRAEKIYRAGGTITRRDVLAELVFGNHAALLGLRGHEIRAAIENGLSEMPRPDGRFPQLSGLKVEADLSRPPGRRVTAIRIGGAPLVSAKRYKVATNDFIANGGDGYTMLRNAPRLIRDYDAPLVASSVIAYLARLGAVDAAIDGRMLFRPRQGPAR